MISKHALIQRINDIPDCPLHVAQVGRDLQAATNDVDVEDIIVTALMDAYHRAYELQAKLYETISTPPTTLHSMDKIDVKALDPQLVEDLRKLLG